MIKNKKQMLLVVGAFALVLMLGTVTYAFFNYTRTGTANVVRTGRISFTTNQTDTIGLTNAFPITRTMASTDTTNTDDVVITITGDTSYSGGIEYLVTATDVTNTVNSKTVPISIIPTVSHLGTSDDSYFTNRGGNSSIYKVLANETISNNDQLLVGYIAPDNNQTGINGSITIRAFLDSDLVAISDTYNDGNTPTDNKGTPAIFGENKTVLTTTEWNGLQTNGVSFKVKVEANEGTWVTAPVVTPTLASCPGEGCVYRASFDTLYTTWNTVGETPSVLDQTGDYYTDYQDVINNTGYYGFYGLVLNDNNEIERAYVCGLKDGTELFCLENTLTGKYSENVEIVQGNNLWNGACDFTDNSNSNFACGYEPDEPLQVYLPTDGSVVIVNGDDYTFYVYTNGTLVTP